MRRFFLAQRIGVQVVARPLPDVIEPAQGPAQGILRDRLLGGDLQGLLEQRHRPTGVREAQVLGGAGEQGLQQMLLVFVQQRMTPSTSLVRQRGRVAGLLVSLHPVVNTLPGHAEHTGEVGGRAALVVLQDGQGAPKEASVASLRELTPQAPPLPESQVELAHGLLLHH